MLAGLEDRAFDAALIVFATYILGVCVRNLARRSRIFISIPMASIRDKNERESLKIKAKELSKDLKLKFGLDVYCAYLNAKDEFDEGHKAFQECFHEIRKCNYFVAFLPEPLPTSTYVEIGFALARRKSVTLYHLHGACPYLLKEIETTGIPLMGNRMLAHRIEVESLEAGMNRLRDYGLGDFPGWAKHLRFPLPSRA